MKTYVIQPGKVIAPLEQLANTINRRKEYEAEILAVAPLDVDGLPAYMIEVIDPERTRHRFYAVHPATPKQIKHEGSIIKNWAVILVRTQRKDAPEEEPFVWYALGNPRTGTTCDFSLRTALQSRKYWHEHPEALPHTPATYAWCFADSEEEKALLEQAFVQAQQAYPDQVSVGESTWQLAHVMIDSFPTSARKEMLVLREDRRIYRDPRYHWSFAIDRSLLEKKDGGE